MNTPGLGPRMDPIRAALDLALTLLAVLWVTVLAGRAGLLDRSCPR